MIINIKQSKAGTPSIESTPTVNIFIGIIKPMGCTNKLYPYNKKKLITIRFIILNNIFNIFVHLIYIMFKIIFYDCISLCTFYFLKPFLKLMNQHNLFLLPLVHHELFLIFLHQYLLIFLKCIKQ